jgi:hypothetical protein
MLHATLKYYLQDDQDSSEQYDVFRARLVAAVTERFAFVLRAETMEHSVIDITSVLFGIAYRF